MTIADTQTEQARTSMSDTEMEQSALADRIGMGLDHAERVRAFVADAAGTEGGPRYSVYGDLAAIDDMVSDLERVRDRLLREPGFALSAGRAEAVAAMLARLQAWNTAMEAGTLRAGELQADDFPS